MGEVHTLKQEEILDEVKKIRDELNDFQHLLDFFEVSVGKYEDD